MLAELMRALARGERRWTEVTRLSEGAVSLPSGVLHRVPIGAPVTLHTLAALMVALSDNTAADQLLRVLGRDRIEAVMEVTGHARPASNTPFLSTRELFVLKAVLTESQAREYGRSPTQVRRRIVRATAKVDLASVTALQPTRPKATQTIDWFASASDLVNLLAWIHAHSKSAPAVEVLRLLAATPGFDQVRTRWRYFGFKGGSEPGVMNLSFPLQHPRGAWYAASAGWNDGNACLDEPKFAASSAPWSFSCR